LILPSELLRVRRSKGRVIFLYAGDDKTSLAKTLISTFKESVGKKYGNLLEALDRCEDLGYNYRLVRGLSTILTERCAFQTRAIMSPIEARRVVFEEVGSKVIATAKERSRILSKVSSRIGLRPEDLDANLYADLADEQILSEFRDPEPMELLREYNFSATLAMIVRAKRIELRCRGKLEEPSKSLGRGVIKSERGEFTLNLEMNSMKRAGQQQAELERLIASLLLQEEWSISAELPSGKKSYLFELSKRKNGSLVSPKSLRKKMSSQGSSIVHKEKTLGDIILLEELASSLGVTESEARARLAVKGSYINLGDVFISASKMREIEETLRDVHEMKLSDVIHKLRKLGCRRPLQVLEALGYSVDWTENRDDSRIRKLSGLKKPLRA